MNQDIVDWLGHIVSHNEKTDTRESCRAIRRTNVYGISPSRKHRLLPKITLLLRAGADPNGADKAGNGVLHYLVMAGASDDWICSVARVLLDAGAHLDRVNKEGKTAAEVWKNFYSHRSVLLPDWLKVEVPKMKCFAARIIRRQKIPYVNELPVFLHFFFVGMHQLFSRFFIQKFVLYYSEKPT